MRVDILIPTMDNRQYVEPCVRSILRWTEDAAYAIWLVNNGAPASCDWAKEVPIHVLEAGGNRGWTGGLALGLEHSDAPAVLFLNDDTLIPPCQPLWLADLLVDLQMPGVGAVGPSSNVAMGKQNISCIDAGQLLPVPFLIGFCLILKRATLDTVGGVDPSLPGGDDIDLSMRLLDAGYTLFADRTVFVYHHGFTTGRRVYGPEIQPGGWNSLAHGTGVAEALTAKFGPERVLAYAAQVRAYEREAAQ